MKNLVAGLLFLLFVASSTVHAQTKTDEDAVRQFAAGFPRRLG